MTMSRRRFVAGATGTTALAALAGCLGVITGSEALTFDARPATLPESAREGTGYEEDDVSRMTVTREVSAAGQTREVEANNVLAQYDKGVDLPMIGRLRAAVFTVLSTPKVDVLGRTFNPVADMSTDELVEMVQRRYENVQNVERVDSRTVSLLGEETNAVRYRADATLAEESATAEVHLTVTEAVGAGEDFVLCFAGSPTFLDEQETVTTFIEATEHEP
ncbi:DUF6517 family protein [Halomarina ordinaria]|uniref:DUF6517 family protein n=1 Tax=Halomarina ordinaria TaxID=3033939 RepID=A0ABD5UAD1_9EURY|nr:DUF6517 family protein [Halomarina sp. PSRA2]